MRKYVAVIVMVLGLVFVVAGAVAWFSVQNRLADAHVTVAEDADSNAGEKVDGPFTALSQAKIIEKHTMKETHGKQYADLPRDSEKRPITAQSAALQTSLYMSVLSFGFSAFVFVCGVLFVLLGLAEWQTDKEYRLRTGTAARAA